jgi:histidinol phosphatase-like enzyme (inositol monophosphatase family)
MSTSENFDVAKHLDEVADMVRTASRLSLDWYRRPGSRQAGRIDNKSAAGFDPVTEADRAVETELRRRLEERFPGHAILGEEFGLSGESRYRWVIDPIDGTRAFITGQPMWGTLLGLEVDGRPTAGWMHVPSLDETFIGHQPAPANGTETAAASGCVLIVAGERRIATVSEVTELADATVLSTDPTMFASGWEAVGHREVADRAKLVRYAGDCLNYGLLAMGLADLVVENGLASYDIVPLIPIVEAAGGLVTDLDGAPPVDGGFVVAAATSDLHAETLEILNRARTGPAG